MGLPDQAGVKHIDWSSDGQLLAASTNQGAITVFVTKLHALFAVSAPRVALLSSLAEVSLHHYTPDRVDISSYRPDLLNITGAHFSAADSFGAECGFARDRTVFPCHWSTSFGMRHEQSCLVLRSRTVTWRFSVFVGRSRVYGRNYGAQTERCLLCRPVWWPSYAAFGLFSKMLFLISLKRLHS